MLFGVFVIVLSYLNDSGLSPSIVLPFQIIKGIQIAGFMAIGLTLRSVLIDLSRFRALLLMVPLIVVYVVSAVMLSHTGIPWGMVWVIKLVAATSGATGFLMPCIVISKQPLLARIGRDSLVFYAVNAMSLNMGKLVFFKILHIDVIHSAFVSQLIVGLFVTAFSMVIMFLINLVVQRYLWWSIGKDRSGDVLRLKSVR